jgi:hypothetical protein
MDNPESHSNWHGGITKQIGLLKETLGRRNYRKYKIGMLQCLANRIDQFFPECGQCQMFKQDVTTLVQDVSSLSQMPNSESRKQYFKSMNSVIGHFQRHHKLVPEGYYVGIWMAIGSGIGVAIGAATDNIGSGIPIGVGVGLAIGSALEAKAKKEDRILCLGQEKTTITSRRNALIIGILIALLLTGILAFVLFNRSN